MESEIQSHAIKQAFIRYGLDINRPDLVDMCKQCIAGSGRLAYLPDKNERHIVTCRGMVLVVVYSPCITKDFPFGKIITILPKEAAMTGAKSSYATKLNSKKMRPRQKLPKKNRQRKGY